MSGTDTPKDPQELRREIEETRAQLGETVESLAAKTDVKARAKHAASDAADQAREKLASAKDQAAKAAGAVADRATSAKDRLAEADVPGPARRPLPWAAIGAAVAGLVAVIIWARRRRS